MVSVCSQLFLCTSNCYIMFYVFHIVVPCCLKDELLAELEEMEEEELNRQLLDVGGTVADELPAVPSMEPSRPEPRVG